MTLGYFLTESFVYFSYCPLSNVALVQSKKPWWKTKNTQTKVCITWTIIEETLNLLLQKSDKSIISTKRLSSLSAQKSNPPNLWFEQRGTQILPSATLRQAKKFDRRLVDRISIHQALILLFFWSTQLEYSCHLISESAELDYHPEP